MKVSVWEGCYDKSLNGFIVPEAFSHPAKFSLGLIERIYDYCLEQHYFERGDVIGDCFGGVGIGGIAAAYRGLNWAGCELEPKFVTLAELNFAMHRGHWEILGCAHPTIFRGDSRRFDHHVASVVSSPPYSESIKNVSNCGTDPEASDRKCGPHSQQASRSGYGETEGQIGRLKSGEVDAVVESLPFTQGYQGGGGINKNGYTARPDLGTDFVGKRSYQGTGAEREPENIETLKEGSVHSVITSPPYSETLHHGGGPDTPRDKKRGGGSLIAIKEGYPKSDGQIGELKPGSVSGVISSPPYSDIAAGAGGLNTKPAKKAGQQSGRRASSASQDTNQHYGAEAGQISQLKGGSVEAVVSSPPWENNAEGGRAASKFSAPEKILRANRGNGASDAAMLAQAERDQQKTYGESPGQIGREKGETYWQAMAAVYRSCFQAIKPGGVIVLVLKDYVKKGKRVPLCDDTVTLLTHIGFEPIERIHAMLVKESVHGDLFIGETKSTKSRKSFFRRLAESKGSPAIDYEEVLILRRP